MDTDELAQRLARLAERTAPPPREELAQVVLERGRTQRRQRAAVTSLVAAVAAVVVAAPLLLDGPPGGHRAADEHAVATSIAGVDVLAGPTRGSLAGDAAFLEAVRRLPWTSEDMSGSDVPDAPLDSRRVVFAGDVPGGRWVLVAGENTARPANRDPAAQTDLGALSDTAIAWFAGPPGATPGQLELQSLPRGVDAGRPAALADAGTGALVVVAAPGDTVEVSLRPEVAADGEVGRSWQELAAPDGVAVTTTPPVSSPYAGALRYRVTRQGAEVVTTGPDGRWNESSTAPDVPVDWLRPAPPASPADVVLSSSVVQVLSMLGLSPEETAVDVVWAGDVPAPYTRPARVHLFSVTLPSGATYTDTSLSLDMGGGAVAGTSCGSGIRPAGLPVPEQTFALRCDATDFSDDSGVISSLVLVAPAGATSARALDLDGGVLAEFPLTDGVAVVPFPERAASVQTMTADGSVLASTRPLAFADLGD